MAEREGGVSGTRPVLQHFHTDLAALATLRMQIPCNSLPSRSPSPSPIRDNKSRGGFRVRLRLTQHRGHVIPPARAARIPKQETSPGPLLLGLHLLSHLRIVLHPLNLLTQFHYGIVNDIVDIMCSFNQRQHANFVVHIQEIFRGVSKWITEIGKEIYRIHTPISIISYNYLQQFGNNPSSLIPHVTQAQLSQLNIQTSFDQISIINPEQL